MAPTESDKSEAGPAKKWDGRRAGTYRAGETPVPLDRDAGSKPSKPVES